MIGFRLLILTVPPHLNNHAGRGYFLHGFSFLHTAYKPTKPNTKDSFLHFSTIIIYFVRSNDVLTHIASIRKFWRIYDKVKEQRLYSIILYNLQYSVV